MYLHRIEIIFKLDGLLSLIEHLVYLIDHECNRIEPTQFFLILKLKNYAIYSGSGRRGEISPARTGSSRDKHRY